MSLNGLKFGERSRLIRLSNLPSLEKFVLFVINCRLWHRDMMHDSQAVVAADTSLSRRAVQKVYKDLKKKGLIKVHYNKKENGHNGIASVEIMFENIGAYLDRPMQRYDAKIVKEFIESRRTTCAR